ncbi:MAG TPA: secretin N-terminal domain-containing protein [Lacipirellulaceae bacterium]|nr:secretin N-terminal domain-containing protein [Lacipirellulaceae bacterium]
MAVASLLAFTGPRAFAQHPQPSTFGAKTAPQAAASKTSSPATNPASQSISASSSAAASTTNASKPTTERRLTFSFRYQPWQEVLDWFAQQAGLSLLMDSAPAGTFNYTDTRTYTPAEALDVLNGVLLTKGYTLVRHGRMLVLVNLEDGIPPNLVPDVPLTDLDARGEYELIRVIFPVWTMKPEQAAAEVQPLLGPQGKVITLPQAHEIQVTETAGRLRTIRSVINAVEQPDAGTAGMREFPLHYITFDAAMPTIRQMLGIPSEAFSTPDGSVQITKSATGEKILFRGTAEQSTRLTEILRLIDVPEAARGINGAPQMEAYTVTAADPDTVVTMLQSLLHNDPSVVLKADKEGGHIFAFAPPPLQATIRATIDQLQKDSRQVDVIALSNVDPQTAVVAINKLFGTSDEKPDPKAPRVDADLTTHSLLVRGTAGQVAQIRELLHKLGESDEEGGVASAKSKQHVRLLPLSGAAARSAISQIEQIWPSVRSNRIRVVSPSATIQSFRPSDSSYTAPLQSNPATPTNNSTDQLQQLWQSLLKDRAIQSTAPQAKPAADGAKLKDNNDRAAESDTPNRFRLVADDVKTASPKKEAPKETVVAPKSPVRPEPLVGVGAPIVIAPGPGGTLIASDDLEALDQLEDLLSTVAGHNAASDREYAVFYLKYSKAPVIAEVLAAIFGGSTGGKDHGIIGDIANNALGDVGGGLMGDLLLGGGGGSSGGAFTSASVDIVPDARLNALLVHAKAADLDTIEQLLKVLDQRAGPEDIEAEAQPRPIPLYNTTAAEMAQIVQEVYQDRMAGASGAMSPQEMMKMIRGGNNVEQQVQKMSLAVDTHNNVLIVRAPDQLFQEVKAMVTQLDESYGADSPQTTRVVALQHTNSEAVQKALASMVSNVQTSTTPAQGQSTASAAQASQHNDEDTPQERMQRAMRHNWEMLQEMRHMQEGAQHGSDHGGFDRSRFFGRGGSRGRESGGDSGRGDHGRGSSGSR